jgi:hypothetical protein
MLPAEVVRELRESWLPNASPAGLDRVIDLLEKGSPFLLSGRFTETLPRGCLATHIGWHHPAVAHRTFDAGILWLTRVARLNPATSVVIREWDRRGPQDWAFRTELLELLKEARGRSASPVSAAPSCEPAGV